MHSDDDQYETSTTGLTPDSELFTVLPADAARVAGEEMQSRKPSRVRSSTYVTQTCQVRTNIFPKEECGLHFLLNESFCREQNRVAATPVLRYVVTLNEFLAC